SLKARVKIQERLEARRIKAPFLAIKEPALSFPAENVSEEGTVLQVTDYGVTFDEVLLENVNFAVGPTEKIALIGANGTGKTTLLRDIYKHTNPSIQLNPDTKVCYLSQLQGEMLEESQTVKEYFLDAGLKNAEAIFAHLSQYSFEEAILEQPISALSGGEKNMLQLAKIALTPSNLLLLDEPTSHLDTYSQIALEKALASYEGAILMISHDFYSIVNCMDYALIIDDKTIRKISMRKFRKMIYANHFDKDYLAIEQKKTELETKIELALKANDFVKAKTLCESLAPLIQQL
ncbi:MAG: ATP-binding cassette domain-containing protein, partial [Cellulosilyticaceae bacterium]